MQRLPIKRQVITSLFIVIILFLFFGAEISGQVAGPNATEPGAPLGSYRLNDLENLNYFNGRFHFGLPLLNVGGRGSVRQSVNLTIDPQFPAEGIGCRGCPGYFPLWAARNEYEVGFGPGVMEAVVDSDWADHSCTGPGASANDLARTTLAFKASDGTTYRFVDIIYQGQVKVVQDPCTVLDERATPRGNVFVTKDGSGATFISDADIYDSRWGNGSDARYHPSGLMKLRDGTIYRIDNGTVTWIRDSNGNQISYLYYPGIPYFGVNPSVNLPGKVKRITDPLGRQIDFTYDIPTGVATERYDEISYKGFGNQTRIIRVYYKRLQNAFREPTTLQTYCQLEVDCESTFSLDLANPLVVSSVLLPNNQSYHFYYNKYAELSRYEVPTGGAVEFEYDWGLHIPLYQFDFYRRVTERRTYPDGGSGAAFQSKTTVSRPEQSYFFANAYHAGFNIGYVEVDHIIKPNGTETRISRERHYYNGMAGAPTLTMVTPTWGTLWGTQDPPAINNGMSTTYQSWKDGLEYKTEYFAGDGFTVLRRIEKTWQQSSPPTWWTFSPDYAPKNDPRVVETVTTLTDVTPNLVSKVTAIDPSNPNVIGFDQYNNSTDIWEYDFGSGGPGALIRHTHKQYVTDSAYTDAQTGSHQRSLPSQVQIFDGAGNVIAKSSFAYDETAFPLLPYENVTGWVNPGPTKRGNPTTVTRWVNTNNTWLPIHTQFDQVGNICKIWDARDITLINPAQIEYSATYQFAFPTLLKTPDPDLTTSGNGPSGSLTTIKAYDLATGLLTTTTDPNNISTTFEYNDSLERITHVIHGWNTGAQSQATFSYDDANRKITQSSDLHIFNDNVLQSQTSFDAMGRTIESRLYEGGPNYIAVTTQYDALGRPYKKSNPFRPLQGESEIWTTSLFEDALGRLTKVTTPDNAVVTTSYSGNATTVTDQSGRQRKSVVDALGRLKNIYEAPDDSNYNYLTTYGYDVLDNLIAVSQGSQTRNFNYDSLSRLISVFNPETGTISYQYDASGNLLVKTDARGVSGHFDYDALSRLKRRWYNGSANTSNTVNNNPQLPTSVGQTDEVNFYYDSQALPYEPQTFIRGASIGHLVAVTYGGVTSTTGDYYGYDEIGRKKQKFQRLGAIDYKLSTSYNAAGLPTSLVYPSGHSVSYSYDSAARISNFTGTLGNGSGRNYSTEATYSPFGGLTKEKFGTTTEVYNKLFYNSRGQLSEIRESTSWTGPNDLTWNRGAIINHYSDACSGMCGGSNSTTPMTDNNGNLRKQDVYIPNQDQIPTTDFSVRSQQYNYDKLNRLVWARETFNNADQWRQWFSYDQYGNRTIDTNPEPADPHLRTWGAVNNTAFATFDLASTNRLYAPGDQSLSVQNRRMQYDEVGNLKADTYTGSGYRTYDAENKMTAAIGGPQNTPQLYIYDALGQRIKRVVNGIETWIVYGFGGEMVAEYAVNGVTTSPQKEYGYRSGQLLISATITTGWGTAPEIHDNPLVVGVTTVQALHITELRNAINALRSHLGMAAYSWQTSATTNNLLSADPILEMRTALEQALGQPPNGYSPGLAQNQLVKAVHIQELRDRVLGAWITGTGVDLRWLVTDQLGTPRMIFDQNGALNSVSRHDYLPFGEELSAGVGGRTTAQGFSDSDGLRQRFTQKERDPETGFDFFGARYYASQQGRFSSPDPWIGSAEPASPQTWNRYTYVLNNPLRLIDPSGLDDQDPANPGSTTGGLKIPNPCTEKKAGCNTIVITNVEVPIEPDTTPLTTTAVFSTTIAVPSSFALSSAAVEGVGAGPVGLMLGGYVLATPSGMMADEQDAYLIAGLSGLDTSMHEQAQAAWIDQTLKFMIWLGISDAPAGSWDQDGNLNDPTVIVRGGVTPDFTLGVPLSGAYGANLFDAGSGVPHNQIWQTTAAEIRKGGGSVRRTPEAIYPGGPINYRHATIILGTTNPFVGPIPNPAPKEQRISGKP
ncbi:MAG TPA: RHS repeat-associated core domain-containing protein [Pyrinomonadaceae bacterium]|nr:RHS repeat-associated core domain-containing protein [Pyrinomonadaceae bacterium]